MPTENPLPGSVDEAANTISGLLNQEPAEQAATPEAAPEAAQELQAETATETAEPATRADTPETLAPTGGDTDEPQRYDVKYGDTTESLTVEELVKNNLMERDYRHKSMQLGDQQRTVDAKQVQLEQALSDLEAVVTAEAQNLSGAEMQQLRVDDPGSYLNELEKTRAKHELLTKIKAQKLQTDTDQRNTDIQREGNLMIQAIPEWLDKEAQTKEWNELSVYLNGFGVNINTITQHRDIVNARKAMLFDRTEIQASLASKKQVTAPKSTTPNAPQSKPEVTDAVKARRDTLAKTGRRQDAQAVIKDLLEGGIFNTA